MDGVAEESRATMASKSSDSASKPRNSHGGEMLEGIGDLTHKMNQLRKQIQAERVVSIKEKVEKNRKKLEIDVSQLKLATFRNDALFAGQSGSAPRLISSRMGNPLCKYGGFGYGLGDKDYINSHEVAALMSTKLSYIEKIPPYTTWIFLARNQRMAEDQSVVGRRRIYYDQHGSEALICSDSEEEVEPGEEKRDFSEGEDRIMWMVFQEHGLSEEVLNSVSQFIGATPSEIQERCSTLKEKYNEEPNIKDSGGSRPEIGISVDKSLSAALDSFDNLFCRRCLLFDCRLHGCSQTLIDPSERQPYWPEYEDNRKPCSDQCYLRVMLILASAFQLRGAKDLPEVNKSLSRKDTENSVKENIVEMSSDAGEPSCTDGAADLMQAVSISLKDACNSELVAGALCLDMPTVETQDPDHLRKRKALAYTDKEIDESIPIIDDRHDSSRKKHRRLLAVDLDTETVDDISNPAQSSSAAKTAIYKTELQVSKNTVNDSSSHASESFVGSQQNFSDVKDVTEVNKSSGILRKLEGIFNNPEWNLIEKELYMKGVEIFGKNSCLIARNLLSGLKTCLEVSNYMCNSGATMSHRSLAPSSFMEDNGENDTDYGDQDMSTRTRLFRRRGRTRKLKYSWKSAGHPSFWKRIVEGKNLSCKQYTPCGCQSMCGKQCPCLDNGTCCEKYCGCSKSCKNRFRGCHCAKSQCRSRQCPCFAAGRECDPDVCRNCWVSCGGDSLGEPPKRGDGQCGNMRLLLRQQQRILLAKSDVAGWGAFLKNSVNKNDYLGEYTGELISHREADKRGKIYDRANSSFLFDLNDQYVLDAYRKGDKLKFANHSSNPNCYAKVMLVAGDHRVGIFAKEHIDASEELFYDYRYGPDQAPAWARKPEGSKRDDSTVSQGRAKKHQSH